MMIINDGLNFFYRGTRIGSPVISTALGCGRRGRKCPSEATSGFSVPVRIVLPITKQVLVLS